MISDETIEVPTEQFARHILPLALEGEIEWAVDDEVRESIGYDDLADPSNLTVVEVDEDRVLLGGTLTGTVSEQVARRTHWHPAEYKNHDVLVSYDVVLEWPDDNYEMPQTEVHVHQEEDPLAPPEPDI